MRSQRILSGLEAPRMFSTALVLSALGASALPASGALTAYYTLDNADVATTVGSGLKNGGMDGATSNLALMSGKTDGTVQAGIIGNALAFSSTLYKTTNTTTNAVVDLGNTYPYTLSIWVHAPASGFAGTVAMGTTNLASSDRYAYLGLQTSTGDVIASRRNSTSFPQVTSDSNTPTTSGAAAKWHHIVGVFAGRQSTILYLDGKQVLHDTTSDATFVGNTLTLGGVVRNSTEVLSAYSGSLDDAGLFSTALTAVDIALINGLGNTGGSGLPWLDEAQALNAAAVNTTADINGKTWKRVNNLTGAVGDWGGSVASMNAYIVTSNSGDGIAVVPEPASLGMLGAAATLLMRRRKRA